MKKLTFAISAMALAAGVATTACQSGTRQKSSINDTIQSDVSAILERHLKEYGAEAGKVIVVETTTGKIRAMVGLARDDSTYKADAHEFEYCHSSDLSQGVSLLAMLEKGRLTLDSKIDTGNGVYIREEYGDTIYDHNWSRGGYGEMSLREVFARGSAVGMVKAEGQSFANRDERIEQERKIIDEAGAPNSFVGYSQGSETYYYLLDFYNAIANDGMMIKTTDKEGSVVVVNPQIAETENIKSMKSVLRYTITDGLGMKANSDKVKIAGACATTEVDDGSVYGDFIGYFPAEAPAYTVLVSVQRNGFPASGGSMAGTIFKEIAELLYLSL